MKRKILTLSAAALVAGSSLMLAGTAATPPKATPTQDACSKEPSKWARMQCENYHHSAPGDEYFGRMKLSYLGMNNTFRDAAISAGGYTTDSAIINKLGFADEALNQWASKYPGDPDLARTYFLAIRAYKKVYTQPAQEKAWRYMQLLVSRFPTSFFGKTEKADLAKGFTEHWFALPQICPTAMPSGAPIPENSPSATATPPSAPGQPKVALITPPCVQPTPVPTATPEPVASPYPSSSPSASMTPMPAGTPAASTSSSPSASTTAMPAIKTPSSSAPATLPNGAMSPTPMASASPGHP